MFRDIELFNPKFVRTERETTNYQTGIDYNENIIFDFINNNYVARNKERYGDLTLNEYLKNVEQEKGFVSYHISLRSADNKRALLVFEIYEKGGDEIIK